MAEASLPPITVRSYGAGSRPVVLLHGGPGAQGMMKPLARELEDEFHLLEPLQRRSGCVELSVARHVEDLAEVVTQPAQFVGSSWGAMLGLSFAAAHPHRVERLILVGCGTYDLPSRKQYIRAMEQRLTAEKRPLFEALRAKLGESTTAQERDRIFSELGAMAMRAQAFDAIKQEDLAPECDHEGYQQTWSDVLRLQSEEVEPAVFASITCPVLMIHGANDPHPGPSTRDTLQSVVPQLQFHQLPRCGHIPWCERHAGKPFLKLLREHLR